MLAYEGLSKMAKSLVSVCTDGHDDIEARSDISYAAMLSGICIANGGLTTIHGIAPGIGGLYENAPHGAVCASLLLAATTINLQRIKDFEPTNEGGIKYAKLGALLLGVDYNPDKHEVFFRAVVDTFKEWQEVLNIPKLREFGVSKDDFWKILENSTQRANPVELSESEMEKILEMSF